MTQDRIKLATPEQVEQIKENSNLTATCRVLAMGDQIAVWRNCHEIDPLHPNGASPGQMYKFMWGIENILLGAGVTEYFFNTPADDTHYTQILDRLGAKRLSKQPDYRWRVDL